jgi:Tat protein translocase TatB subunit
MFGIGMTELMVIFVIGLVVLGPKRLPEMARSLGRSLAEFRRASNDMRREFMAVSDEVKFDPHAFDSPSPGESHKPAVPGTATASADPDDDSSPGAADPKESEPRSDG